MMGGSVNDAMASRACALLYDKPGLEWEPIIEAMTITGDEKRAGRVLQDLVEIGDVERCLDGSVYRYYLSPGEREAREDLEIGMRVAGLMGADEIDRL